MTASIVKSQLPCREELNCFYKIGNGCSFRQQVKAMLSVLQGKYHRGSNCFVNIADTFEFPFKNLDEEGRQRGIGNIFTDPSTMH